MPPWAWALLCAAWVVPRLGAAAEGPLPVPPLQARVTDLADLLPAASRSRLESRLAAYEKVTGQQFAVLIVPTLQGDPVEDYAVRVFEAWKLGKVRQDKGLLLLIVPEHRAIRIEVGYGLEGSITDALAKRIIAQLMTPAFRQARYAAGIDAALSALMQAGSGKVVGAADPGAGPSAQAEDEVPLTWLLLLLLVFGPMILVKLLGGGRGHGGGGFGGFGGGFGGGGGWSGGGGGFSGGGGSSGGGGASGSW